MPQDATTPTIRSPGNEVLRLGGNEERARARAHNPPDRGRLARPTPAVVEYISRASKVPATNDHQNPST